VISNSTNNTAASAAIKGKALELGFSQVGVVPAEPLAEEETRLRNWLARGFHGEMKWMERDPSQRADPHKIFPEARSVVVVTMNYFTPHEHRDSPPRNATVSTTKGSDPVTHPATGKVSRYAWGDDYHDVVRDKLRELLSWIKEQWPEADGKVCVDIQPMMDKAWAARAGLGWIGKHSNLITREYGSWVFIGELLLNLELEFDELQIADQCGTCTLCLDACPTGAIGEPYVVDSNLCISHATIESRAGEMPARVGEHLDGWLYGCDVCQDVCPWNQMTPATNEARFEPRQDNVNASLSEILELTQDAYATRFRRSAMKRAKLAGLQRNARTLLNGSEHRRVPKAH
jgi:epoxyqueuosine reductase